MSVVPSDTAERDEDLALVAGEERPEPAEPARRSRVPRAPRGAPPVVPSGVRRAPRAARRARATPRRGRRRGRARRRGARASRASASREHVATGRGDGERGDPAVVVEPRRAPPARARPACRRSPRRWAWPSASWPARSLARSAPLPIMARSRYCARVSGGSSSPHARSSSRARRARVSRSSSTPEVYRTVRDPTYVRSSSVEARIRRLRSPGKPAFTAA